MKGMCIMTNERIVIKERIVFCDCNHNRIATVDDVSNMDWITIFEHLTKDELKKIKEAYISFNNEFTFEDIENDNDFEEYLCDDITAEGGFYYYEKYEECKKAKKGLTLRQLYEMAKKYNALDTPIKWNYSCSDSWYDIEDEVITKEEVDFSNNTVYFFLKEAD